MLPIVDGMTTGQFSGVPLAKLSIQSVILTYLRGIAGALIVVSVIPLVLAVVMGTERLDTLARIWIGSAAIALVLGLVIGAASYLMGRHVNPRSGKIRSACAQVLGLAADPALVTCEFAESMKDEAGEALRECGVDDPESAVDSEGDLSNEVLALLLVRARAKLQLGHRSEKYESQTDRILARLS